MTYIVQENSAGWQAIATTSTVRNHPLGSRVRAHDPTLGAGEFIYLKGVASTVLGSWVTYNTEGGLTALLTANAVGPVAVAMSANVANQYGWYQIAGLASAKVGDVADSSDVYIDTVDGQVDDALVAGDRVWNARFRSDDDTSGYASVQINEPFVDDGINGGTT